MCRRPRRSKISADPHKLHDVGAADALEVADVDVAVDGDDRHHGEIGVQGVVELAGAGAAAALVGGRAELAGLSGDELDTALDSAFESWLTELSTALENC